MRIMPPAKTLSIGEISGVAGFQGYRFEILILNMNEWKVINPRLLF